MRQMLNLYRKEELRYAERSNWGAKRSLKIERRRIA